MGSDKCFYNWSESAVSRTREAIRICFMFVGIINWRGRDSLGRKEEVWLKEKTFWKGLDERNAGVECFWREE